MQHWPSSCLCRDTEQAACRLQFALSHCTRQWLHAEQLVKALVDDLGLRVERLPFYFFRMRANGQLARGDVSRTAHAPVPICNETQLEPFKTVWPG